MVFRTVVNFTSKRIPMIKFRKGGLALATDTGAGGTESAAGTAAQVSTAQYSGTVIEDWELPPRFWRKPIEEDEMEYINCGGPVKY